MRDCGHSLLAARPGQVTFEEAAAAVGSVHAAVELVEARDEDFERRKRDRSAGSKAISSTVPRRQHARAVAAVDCIVH